MPPSDTIHRHDRPATRRRPAVALALPLLVLGAAMTLVTPTGARAATHAVGIGDGFFAPPAMTVGVGDTVTWTNDDDSPHTVTAAGAFDSGNLDPGQTFSFTFTEAGTYTYVCQYHDEMVATITVVAASAPASQAPAAGTTSAPNDGAQPDTALFEPAADRGPAAWLTPLLIGLGLVSFAVAVAPQRGLRPVRRRGPAVGWRR